MPSSPALSPAQRLVVVAGSALLCSIRISGAVPQANPDLFAIDEDTELRVENHVDVLAATFDDAEDGLEGFVYVDDPFGTGGAATSSGEYDEAGGFAGGGLRLTAGGRVIFAGGSSAAFDRSFNLPQSATVTVSLRYRLVHDSEFEAAEFSQAILEVDGSRLGSDVDGSLVSFAGDGNGGEDQDSGWLSASFQVALLAGPHVVRLGLFNNRSSSVDEIANAYFDDVRITVPATVAGVLANDFGDSLRAQLNSPPSHGVVELDPIGSFRYRPALDFHGIDTFTYRAAEGSTVSAPATVTIIVHPVDDPPRAADDVYVIDEDSALDVGTGAGVLRNDSDPEGAPLSASLLVPPSRGTLVFSEDGGFRYVPFPDFHGADSFTYRVGDGTLTSAPATVVITVRPADDPPAAVDDAYVAEENRPLVIDTATGGRVLVFREDFDDGVADGFFGDAEVVSVQDFAGLGRIPANRFSGFFLRNDTTGNPAGATSLTVSNLPPHDRLTIGFLLAVIDSWEGNDGPDRFTVTVDGNVVFSETLSTADRGRQSYRPTGGAELAFGQHFGFQPGPDSAYDLSLDPRLQSIAHSAPSVTITWSASGDGWQGADDESWAIDNVTVAVATSGPLEPLVPFGSVWRYLDTGADLGTGWRAPDYADDQTWSTGPGRLGYGNDGEVTTIDFGPSANNKHITTYFRRRFPVEDVGDIASARIRLVRDDGAAVFLNGSEIARSNLAAAATFTTLASGTTGGADEVRAFEFTFSPALLVDGENVLAAEVHQAESDSSDLGFDLALDIERTLTAGVLANDGDPDGDPLTVELATPPQHGSIELRPDGTFTYTPDLNYDGSDGFSYVVTDGLLSSPGNVTITVLPGSNELPVPAADQYQVPEDGELSIPAVQGVLANDSDPEGDPLTARLIAPPAHGSLLFNPDGSFLYRPAPDFHGEDRFRYVPSDPTAPSREGIVTITVLPVNDGPLAVADRYAVDPGAVLTVASVPTGVLGNDTDVDGDTLRAERVSGPQSGTLTFAQDGTFTYRPADGFLGTDSFVYRTIDPSGAASQSTATIEVNARPVAQPDAYATAEDIVLIIEAGAGLLANDNDSDSPGMTVRLIDPPAHGVVALAPDGSFSYIPGPNFSGIDGFTYSAHDGLQPSVPAAVTLSVSAVNDAPEAIDDAYSVTTGGSLSVPAAEGVLANDSDVEGSALTAILVSPPASGTLSLGGDGSFTYTPPAGFSGPVSFAYRAGDGVLTSEPAVVGIAVRLPAENVVISEIMYHPASGNDAEEFVELHNTGELAVSLEGWRFTSGVSFVFPPVAIPPRGYLVVAADPSAFVAAYGDPPASAPLVGGWTGRLSNAGERLRLVDASGLEVDDLRYADDGDWAVRRFVTVGSERGWEWIAPHDGGGASLELINVAVTNAVGTNWTAGVAGAPTPGAANSAAADRTAPLVSEVSHRPAIPRSSDPLVVTARLHHAGPASALSAVVRHRNSTATPGPFAATPMADDGLGADQTAGDGIFSATLPARPNLTVIEFFIEASDGNSSRTYPPPTDDQGTQGANLLAQVDDSVHEGAWPIYRLILSEPEENRFVELPGGPNTFDQNSDAQMNATFIAVQGSDVEVRYNCGVRVRGAGSRGRLPRNWRVNIPGDRDWDGRTRFNLNTQYTFLQLVGGKLHQAAGLPYADINPVRVLMNAVDHSGAANADRRYGLYVHVEPLDELFAENHFPLDPDGNAYKKNRPDVKWINRGTDGDAYREDGWVKQSNGSLDDWSDVDLLTRTMNAPAGPDYMERISPVVNIDQWVRWFAVMTLINNRETNLSNGTDDDYSMYRGAVDPRFLLIGHDLDTILGDGDTATSPDSTIFPMLETTFADQRMPQLDPFFRHPVIARKYHAQLRELLDTVFAKPQFDALLDNCLGGWVPRTRIDGLKSFMDARREHVRSVIPSEFTVAWDLPSPDGIPVVADPSDPGLRGTIDSAGTAQVQVNGVDVRVDPFSGTWSSSMSGESLVPFGSSWRYLDDGSDQGFIWAIPGFDVSGWAVGRGQFGFGDDDETTVVSFGGDPDNKHATTYFRTTFEVPDPTRYTGLEFTLDYDDGFIVYLNGAEMQRVNVPAGADYATYTGEHQETRITFAGDASYLFAGENTLAVQLHQATPDSADLSMDLQLVGLRRTDFGIQPGLNGVVVRALDAGGNEIARQSVPLYLPSEGETPLSGTLGAGLTLTPQSGPYAVNGDLIVPAGVTLTVAPGTSLLFGDGARLIVRGRLVAEGTPTQRIQFGRRPGATAGWDGIEFDRTRADNRMKHVDMEGAFAAGQSIEIDRSRLTLEDATWSGTTGMILEAINPQLLVTGCRFPSTDGAEVIYGTGLTNDEYFVIQGNTFHSATGYNDIIDFTGGRRPGPIVQIRDNLFLGASDDVLDLDGTDAHIEGNWFLHVHSDDPGRESLSAAIATDASADLVVVRNVFVDVDHALLLKNHSKARFEHNTVVRATMAAVAFDEPGRAGVVPGDAIAIESSIFHEVPSLFASQFSQPGEDHPVITIDRSMVSAAFHALGTGNIDADPRLADVPDDVSLLAGSPALGSGRNGLDRGALVPAGASLGDIPPVLTVSRTARIVVNGPGLISYRHRVDGGAWSAETPLANPVQLANLADGPHTVEVVGRDSAGRWQDEALAARATWTVDSALRRIVINEVLADNQGAFPVDGRLPDFVELHNAGSSEADIAGMSLTDDPDNPTKFVFPSGSVLPAGGYLVALAADQGVPGSIALGFALDRGGESLRLFESPARGGGLVDEVVFGFQLPDRSIARLGRQAGWSLAEPTPGRSNAGSGLALGDPSRSRINEWLAGNNFVFDDDFVEIHNADPLPIDLGGFSLTDDAFHRPDRHRIAPLSFVAGGGFVRFVADDGSGSDHLGFRLSKFLGEIALLSPEGALLDRVPYLAQQEDVSEGRLPDGGSRFARFALPTPGWSNATDLAPEIRVIEGLRITEIMYHPPAGPEFEFLEVGNIGSVILSLGGLRLSGGIDFTFPGEALAPGEHAVVVADLAAFRSLYGAAPRVLGVFSGRLDNAGEDLRLEIASLDAAVLAFEYDDIWHPSTDGGGYALVVRDAAQARFLWDREEGWSPGAVLGGTPGAPESSVVVHYADWILDAFPTQDPVITAPERDPDADGLANLVEYALGLDPIAPGSEATLTTGLENGLLTLYYTRRRTLPSEVRIEVEVSSDQSVWTSGAGMVAQSVVADDGELLTIRAVDLRPVGSVGFRGMRLRVTLDQ